MKSPETSSYIDVIGANSMLGDATVKAAKNHGWEVAGTVHHEEENENRILLRHLDITDYEEVREVVGRGFKNRKAIFLASAISNPRGASDEIMRKINVDGVENFFKAYLDLKISKVYWPKFILFGSVLQYEVTKNGAIKENDPQISSGNEYVTGKKQLAEIQKTYSSMGFNISLDIVYRSSGEKQKAGFFVPDTAMKLARMKHLGEPKKLVTWFVENKQDYQYSGKAGEQLFLTASSNPSEVINICSGKSVELSYIVRKLIEVSGLKDVKHSVDPDHNTPPQFMDVYGDNSKITKLGSTEEETIEEMCRKAFGGQEAALLNEIKKIEDGEKRIA